MEVGVPGRHGRVYHSRVFSLLCFSEIRQALGNSETGGLQINHGADIPLSSIYRNLESQDNKKAVEVNIPQARNITKARIHLEQRDGNDVIIKDYSARNFLIRYYGRFTLRREAKAYARLAGIKGFPLCYGFEGKDALVLQYIAGHPPGWFRLRKVKIPESAFDKLDQIVLSMHSRGVANSDLHRSNILLTEAGDVYMVDFASAFISNKPGSPGPLTRLMMQLDLYAAAKIRARYLGWPKPVPKGFFGLLYRTGKCFKLLIKVIR